MNRFILLGSQTDESGQEWCFVLDTTTGTTLKSPVRPMNSTSIEPAMVVVHASGGGRSSHDAVKNAPQVPVVKKQTDPAGEAETPEQRKARLGGRKVPPAFLGDITRMGADPSKTDGRTDVTPFH